jgi:hypothetical protein
MELEESTPRPVLDVDNLEPFEWPGIQWEYILSPALNVSVNVYRKKQKRLFDLYDITHYDDDLDDPDPFQPYYVFFVRESFQPRSYVESNGPSILSYLGLDCRSP